MGFGAKPQHLGYFCLRGKSEISADKLHVNEIIHVVTDNIIYITHNIPSGFLIAESIFMVQTCFKDVRNIPVRLMCVGFEVDKITIIRIGADLGNSRIDRGIVGRIPLHVDKENFCFGLNGFYIGNHFSVLSVESVGIGFKVFVYIGKRAEIIFRLIKPVIVIKAYADYVGSAGILSNSLFPFGIPVVVMEILTATAELMTDTACCTFYAGSP